MAVTEQAKKAHRETVRELRRSLSADFRNQAAESGAEMLLRLPVFDSANYVLGYSANAEEIDPLPALEDLASQGVTVALPRVEGPGELGLHVYCPGDPMEEGAFGISQPLSDSPRLPVDEIDVVIVPGVAFDFAGRRLGYGGGYYDRLLSEVRPDCARVGYAYDEQMLPELPVQEHDERVDLIVTPSRVIETAG